MNNEFEKKIKFLYKLSHEERETHINMTAEERIAGVVKIYTDDPVVAKRILSDGHTPVPGDEIGFMFRMGLSELHKGWLR